MCVIHPHTPDVNKWFLVNLNTRTRRHTSLHQQLLFHLNSAVTQWRHLEVTCLLPIISDLKMYSSFYPTSYSPLFSTSPVAMVTPQPVARVPPFHPCSVDLQPLGGDKRQQTSTLRILRNGSRVLLFSYFHTVSCFAVIGGRYVCVLTLTFNLKSSVLSWPNSEKTIFDILDLFENITSLENMRENHTTQMHRKSRKYQ